MQTNTTFKKAFKESFIGSRLRRKIYDKLVKKPYRIDLTPGKDYQDSGCDLIISSPKGVYCIEEKRRTGAKWGKGDLCCEFESVDDNGEIRLGYIDRLKSTDWLLYYWAGSEDGYFINAKELGRAWQVHQEEWKAAYPVKSSPYTKPKGDKPGYRYKFVCVPFDVLKAAGVKCKYFSVAEPFEL